MKSLLQKPWVLGFIGVGWAAAIVFGIWTMVKEEYLPVPDSSYAENFPTDTRVPLAGDKCTLIVFVHPQCPCTRATLNELPSLLTATHSNVNLVIVFALPAGVPAGWEQGDLFQLSEKLPAQLVLDKDGVESQRFHAVGSGTVLLYSQSGRLLFGGGITPSRGQEGDSIGLEAVTDLIEQGKATVTRTPVFGCALL